MTVEEMHSAIDSEVGRGEWWHPSNGEAIHELANGMVAGDHLAPERVLEIIETVFGAARDEYGD